MSQFLDPIQTIAPDTMGSGQQQAVVRIVLKDGQEITLSLIEIASIHEAFLAAKALLTPE